MSEQIRCATCKHYDPNGHEWDNPRGFGFCMMIAEKWEMTQWDEDTAENVLKPFFSGHLASVSDGSSYSATLNVSPDFFCAMHSDRMPELRPYSEYDQ